MEPSSIDHIGCDFGEDIQKFLCKIRWATKVMEIEEGH
jgi:hypothetical protein